MDLKGKKVTVVGLGRSGFAAAKFLAAQKARVCATDNSQKKEVLENASYLKALGAQVETGGHTEGFLVGADLLVVSPGVPKKSLPLAWARANGVEVISEVGLAAAFCPGRVVAVTGTNGKTTTSHLVQHLLQAAGRKSALCGNVGYSFVEAMSGIDKNTVAVVELSSFQLEDSPRLRPSIAVVLNLSPNHLDRHKTLEGYARAKERIFHNQTSRDFLVLNGDDARVRAMRKKARSHVLFFSKKAGPDVASVWDLSQITVKVPGVKSFTLDTRNFKLKGVHNLQNIAAAACVGALLKLPPLAMQQALEAFSTLEHRIEPLGRIAGVEFINDSKSTTVDSTRAALMACQGPVVLVAGGRDKGAAFGDIEKLLEKRVKVTVLYGEAREKIAKSWKRYRRCDLRESFGDAVKAAFGHASAGDAVLLSPMCTSFDQFNSFEQRGEAFKSIFESLKNNPKAD